MLLDTSGLLCLHHRQEPQHDQARAAYRAADVRFTHSLILAEFVALGNARRLPRVPVLAFVADLLDNPDIETVWVNESLHREAIALLSATRQELFTVRRRKLRPHAPSQY